SWKRWHDAAPPGFRFDVKANRYLTHFLRFKPSPASLKRFFDGAELLGEHLGPALFQARPDFKRTPENASRLDEFMKSLPGRHENVIEFRHESWFGEETMAQLRRHGIGF